LYVKLPSFTNYIPLADLSASAFLYTTLPAGLAANLTDELNRAGASRFAPSISSSYEDVEREVDETYDQWMSEQWLGHLSGRGEGQATFVSDRTYESTMGYVTRDSCPGKGDDIEHVPGMSHFLSRMMRETD